MKNDIDFDELDRAVNSLMGSASVASADDTPKPKTLSISPTLKPDEKPAYEKLGEVAKRIGSETLVTDGDPTIVKNLGEISSSGPLAIAVTNNTIADTVPETPAEAQQEKEQEPPKISSSPAVSRPSSGRFMDVVHPSSDMKTATPPVQSSESTANTIPAEPSPAPKPVAVAEVELTSPFLPDAKVEKRPLGDSTPLLKEEDFLHNDAPEEIVAINSEAAARAESGKNTQEVLDASQFETVNSVDRELQAIESQQISEQPSSELDALRAVESVDAAPAGTQQGAIFDVKEYHQPLNHPPKRKSGWGVVVIIIVIIILAAAVGAGAYFLLGLGN